MKEMFSDIADISSEFNTTKEEESESGSFLRYQVDRLHAGNGFNLTSHRKELNYNHSITFNKVTQSKQPQKQKHFFLSGIFFVSGIHA